jgi:hypothetical protein
MATAAGTGNGGRSFGEVVEDSVMAVKGFFEVVLALGWCVVLAVLDWTAYFFPKRKSFRGETVLITGTCRRVPAVGRRESGGSDSRGRKTKPSAFNSRRMPFSPLPLFFSLNDDSCRRRERHRAAHGPQGK